MSPLQHNFADTAFQGGAAYETDPDRVVREVLEKIHELNGQVNRYTHFLEKHSKGTQIRNRKLEWMTIGDFPAQVTVAEALAVSGDTTLVIEEDPSFITKETCLIDAETGEVIACDDDPTVSTKVLNIYDRANSPFGVLGTPRTIPVGAKLTVLHSNVQEGRTTPLTGIGILPTFKYNWLQQSEIDVAITDIAEHIRSYGHKGPGGQKLLDKMKVFEEEKRRLNRTALFQPRSNAGGEIATVETLTHQHYGAGGLNWAIEEFNPQGIFDASSGFDFLTLSEHVSLWGDETDKILVMGRRARNHIDSWGLESHRWDKTKTDEFGFEINILKIGRKRLIIEYDRSMDLDGWEDTIFAFSPGAVQMHHLEGMGLTLNEYIKGPRNDGGHLIQDQWARTFTFSYPKPKEIHKITGIPI